MGWEGIEAQRQGVDLNTFMVKDNCVPDYYSPVIITSEKTIKEKPDLVRNFRPRRRKAIPTPQAIPPTPRICS